jgi:hypothetical protein
MYYIVTFDPIEGVTRKQITQAYNRFVKHFEKKIPQFKFLGLFVRNVLLGSSPHYTAMWEFPDYSALDEWNAMFGKDKQGQKLARALRIKTTGWEARVMSKLI